MILFIHNNFIVDKIYLRPTRVHPSDLTEKIECGKNCKSDKDCEDGEKCGGKIKGCKEAKKGYGQCKKGIMAFIALQI